MRQSPFRMGGSSHPTPPLPQTPLPTPLSTQCASRLLLYVKWLRRQSLAARAMAVGGPGEGNGGPLASSSLSCRLPAASQCPLGRWGISCSWRATGPHTVGGRDAYKVGVWGKKKRLRWPAAGAGDEGHWGLDEESSWKSDPGVRLRLRWEAMTGSESQSSLPQRPWLCLRPTQANLTRCLPDPTLMVTTSRTVHT